MGAPCRLAVRWELQERKSVFGLPGTPTVVVCLTGNAYEIGPISTYLSASHDEQPLPPLTKITSIPIPPQGRLPR
jgi:hypothetical protein